MNIKIVSTNYNDLMSGLRNARKDAIRLEDSARIFTNSLEFADLTQEQQQNVIRYLTKAEAVAYILSAAEDTLGF